MSYIITASNEFQSAVELASNLSIAFQMVDDLEAILGDDAIIHINPLTTEVASNQMSLLGLNF